LIRVFLFVKLFETGLLISMNPGMHGGKLLREGLDQKGKFMRRCYEAD
jgi:hypothetical protein